MKKLLCLLGGAMSIMTAFAQENKPVKPLFIDSRLPELTFNDVICYQDSVVTLSKFQANKTKLVIFDFWFTHCSSCIAQFPKLDSLQKKFNDQVQIVMVAHEPKAVIEEFINKWEQKHHTKFRLPIITGDTILHKLVRHYFESHYAWVTPDNVLIAQTASYFLNQDVLAGYLKHMQDEIANRGFLLNEDAAQ
jgi:thiol-disulfide isomerase/thioredoxin